MTPLSEPSDSARGAPAQRRELACAVDRDGVNRVGVVGYDVARGGVRASGRGGHGGARPGRRRCEGAARAQTGEAHGLAPLRQRAPGGEQPQLRAMASFFEDIMDGLLAEGASQGPEPPAAAAAPPPLVVDWKLMFDADIRLRARKKLCASGSEAQLTRAQIHALACRLWRPESRSG